MVLLGLTLIVAVSIPAGHPETFLFGGLRGCRLHFVSVVAPERRTEEPRSKTHGARDRQRARGRVNGHTAAPFLEYLSYSARLHTPVKVPWTGIWSGFTTLSALQAFPDLLGSPALPYYELPRLVAVQLHRDQWSLCRPDRHFPRRPGSLRLHCSPIPSRLVLRRGRRRAGGGLSRPLGPVVRFDPSAPRRALASDTQLPGGGVRAERPRGRRRRCTPSRVGSSAVCRGSRGSGGLDDGPS